VLRAQPCEGQFSICVEITTRCALGGIDPAETLAHVQSNMSQYCSDSKGRDDPCPLTRKRPQ
jgi:hypothetical protein